MTSIRDADWWDVGTTAGVLAASMQPTRLGRWLEPDPVVRSQRLREYFDAGVADATRHGAVRTAEHGGTIVAAAIWVPCADYVNATRLAGGEGFERLGRILAVAEKRHQQIQHLRLDALAVLTSRRRRGIARALLNDVDAGTPRCLLAIGDSMTALARRCCYESNGPAVAFADAEPVRLMQRPANDAVVRVHRTAKHGRLTASEMHMPGIAS